MQIKVERFLTLTAMLASTQVGVVGCGDDGSEPEPAAGPDAGGSETTAAETHSSASTGGAGSSAVSTGDAGSGANSQTGSESTSLDVGDSGADAAMPNTGTADAGLSTTGNVISETIATDAAAESDWTDVDAGGFTCAGGDFAEEGAAQACYETFVECSNYSLGYNNCSMLAADYRGGVFEQFWDCYTTENIADPCSEEADIAASNCYSFAVESVCLDEVEECAAIAAGCNEITEDTCSSYLRPYNSGFRSAMVDCMDESSSLYASPDAGPSYEGCSSSFYTCFYGPSVE